MDQGQWTSTRDNRPQTRCHDGEPGTRGQGTRDKETWTRDQGPGGGTRDMDQGQGTRRWEQATMDQGPRIGTYYQA